MSRLSANIYNDWKINKEKICFIDISCNTEYIFTWKINICLLNFRFVVCYTSDKKIKMLNDDSENIITFMKEHGLGNLLPDCLKGNEDERKKVKKNK